MCIEPSINPSATATTPHPEDTNRTRSSAVTPTPHPEDTNRARPSAVAKRQLIRSRGFQPTDKIKTTNAVHRVAKRHLNLTKQVPLIPRQFMLDQNGPEFVLESRSPVMFFLPANVANHRRNCRFANGKNTITILPSEPLQLGKRRVYPTRGSSFDLFHHIANRQTWWDLQQKMHVVVHAPNANGLRFILIGNTSHECPNSRTNIPILQPGGTFFGREYNMEMQAVERAGHQRMMETLRTGSSVALRRYRMATFRALSSRGLKPTATDHMSLRDTTPFLSELPLNPRCVAETSQASRTN